MASATITLKNYRVFARNEPLRIEMRSGLMALIGPNNSGKSSFLKFFHELRNLWTPLAHPGNFGLFLSGNHAINYQDLYDNTEIFCDANDGPIEVRIDFPKPDIPEGEKWVTAVELTAGRNNPPNWSLRAFGGPQPFQLQTNQNVSWPSADIWLWKVNSHFDGAIIRIAKD